MRRASHFTHVTPKLAKVPFYLGGHFSCRMPRTLVQNFVLGDMTIFIVRSHLNLYNCNTLPSELEVEESIGNLQLVIGRSRRQEDRVGMLYPFSHWCGYWYDLTVLYIGGYTLMVVMVYGRYGICRRSANCKLLPVVPSQPFSPLPALLP
jgi:hypothetical protein